MSRIDYFSVMPKLITQLRAITAQQNEFKLDCKLRALVELRVSQINGCVYCTDLHAREARALGETQQRLDMIPVWRESPCFEAREKAALTWAEALTLISESHASEADFEHVRKYFPDQELVELSLSVSLANFWNRMAGGFRRMPSGSST